MWGPEERRGTGGAGGTREPRGADPGAAIADPLAGVLPAGAVPDADTGRRGGGGADWLRVVPSAPERDGVTEAREPALRTGGGGGVSESGRAGRAAGRGASVEASVGRGGALTRGADLIASVAGDECSA